MKRARSSTSRRRDAARAQVGSLLCLVLVACGDDPEPEAPSGTSGERPAVTSWVPAVAPPPIEGAVLSVAGVPILRDALEHLAEAAALATPEYTLAHHRRLALDTDLIPQAALAAAFPEERAAALADAERALEHLRVDPRDLRDLDVTVQESDIRDLGIGLWKALSDGAQGRWVGPVEGLGRWRIARWLVTSEAPTPGLTRFSCELVDFWFVPDGDAYTAVDEALAVAELVVHEPAVGELVTERMRWRMKRPSSD